MFHAVKLTVVTLESCRMDIFMEVVSKVAIGLLSAATLDMRLLEHVQAHAINPQQDGNQRYQDAIVFLVALHLLYCMEE